MRSSLEWLSAHTHRRALRYRTAGFTYHEEHDHWRCPEGEHLWPQEVDDELRLVRYRAKAHICNGCPLKEACTDSDLGREIVRPIDPWPHSEAGRFHRGLSLMLIVLALLIVLVEAVRHHRLGGVRPAAGAPGHRRPARRCTWRATSAPTPPTSPRRPPSHGLASWQSEPSAIHDADPSLGRLSALGCGKLRGQDRGRRG